MAKSWDFRLNVMRILSKGKRHDLVVSENLHLTVMWRTDPREARREMEDCTARLFSEVLERQEGIDLVTEAVRSVPVVEGNEERLRHECERMTLKDDI